MALNAAQGLMVGAAGAFLVLGPAGAAASVAKDSLGMGFKTYMFVKGGSAGEMGRQVADSINSCVKPRSGRLRGVVRGAWGGGISSAKSAAQTGFYEGRAATSGVFEGASQIKTEWNKAAQTVSNNPLARTARRVAGALSAVISAPAGLALALLARENPEQPEISTSTWKRMTVASGVGALAGLALGASGGPIGAAVGAAVGAVVGFVTPAAREGFAQEVQSSLTEARSNRTDLGHPITNRRRDLVETAIVGLASGARAGWDAAVS